MHEFVVPRTSPFLSKWHFTPVNEFKIKLRNRLILV